MYIISKKQIIFTLIYISQYYFIKSEAIGEKEVTIKSKTPPFLCYKTFLIYSVI